MAEYIEREALIKDLQEELDFYPLLHTREFNEGFNSGLKRSLRLLKTQPAADVAPRAEVAREIFEEIEKIIEKHYSECYEYEDGDECDTAITYISYLSVDIDDLKKKYTESKDDKQ